MNFDKLKLEWGKGNNNDVHIPKSIKNLKPSSSHPLDRLKRSMKRELSLYVLGMILFALYPYLLKFHPSLIQIYYVSYSMIFAISIYYVYGFYKFYNSLNHYGADTKNSLLRIYYELQINIEKYKSCGFLFLPLGLILISLFVVNQHLVKGISLGFLIKENVFLLSSVSIVLVGLVMLVINSWANVFYGKYVKQIKAILDDLIEE